MRDQIIERADERERGIRREETKRKRERKKRWGERRRERERERARDKGKEKREKEIRKDLDGIARKQKEREKVRGRVWDKCLKLLTGKISEFFESVHINAFPALVVNIFGLNIVDQWYGVY
jgi:hypothetical protein